MTARRRFSMLPTAGALFALAAGGHALAAGSSHPRSGSAHAAAVSRGFSGKVTYKTTSNGRTNGQGTSGIDGHGAFSAKLGAAARAEAMMLSLTTGIPFTEIARGGTYTAISAETNTANTGVVAAKFRDHALGTACLSYVAKGGKYNPKLGYVVFTGTLTMVGGTGAAAHWRGSASFHQTGLGGMSLESLLFGGAIHASTGPARGMTAACRAAAKA